jgi:hypothetical protein
MENVKNQVIIVTANIGKIKEIFESTNKEGLVSISDHYWLVDHESSPNSHICTISDLMETDIGSLEDNEVYCDLINKYGRDLTDLFVHSNQDIVEKKVVDLIHFAIDKIYNSNEIEVILYFNDSDIQEVIINAMTNNFNVSYVASSRNETHLLVKK